MDGWPSGLRRTPGNGARRRDESGELHVPIERLAQSARTCRRPRARFSPQSKLNPHRGVPKVARQSHASRVWATRRRPAASVAASAPRPFHEVAQVCNLSESERFVAQRRIRAPGPRSELGGRDVVVQVLEAIEIGEELGGVAIGLPCELTNVLEPKDLFTSRAQPFGRVVPPPPESKVLIRAREAGHGRLRFFPSRWRCARAVRFARPRTGMT